MSNRCEPQIKSGLAHQRVLFCFLLHPLEYNQETNNALGIRITQEELIFKRTLLYKLDIPSPTTLIIPLGHSGIRVTLNSHTWIKHDTIMNGS